MRTQIASDKWIREIILILLVWARNDQVCTSIIRLITLFRRLLLPLLLCFFLNSLGPLLLSGTVAKNAVQKDTEGNGCRYNCDDDLDDELHAFLKNFLLLLLEEMEAIAHIGFYILPNGLRPIDNRVPDLRNGAEGIPPVAPAAFMPSTARVAHTPTLMSPAARIAYAAAATPATPATTTTPTTTTAASSATATTATASAAPSTARRNIRLSRGIVVRLRVVADVAVGVHPRRVAERFIRGEEDARDRVIVARDVVVQARGGIVILAGKALVGVLAHAGAVVRERRAVGREDLVTQQRRAAFGVADDGQYAAQRIGQEDIRAASLHFADEMPDTGGMRFAEKLVATAYLPLLLHNKQIAFFISEKQPRVRVYSPSVQQLYKHFCINLLTLLLIR